ncbi:MurR/RpiR family transcriptional regulator [Pseudorhodoferax sp. Leaf267]|uniref:MurR/RpiR family transcriptional regulator n=1 Tax=Pseudorhodoferax sp. Leaf267 TaxID=1736316 RepID=UPI0012E29639|nr:MurR/RpiR family transcriptional regulator [Pseudorhodoferax sp. Leaf267]
MKAVPPHSVEDLRRLVEQERSARGRDRMGERTLAVLVDMLARPGSAAVQSISELAAHNGVDASTLTRLGKRLGFDGFTPLQDVFRRHVSDTQPFYSAHVNELVTRQDKGAADTLQHLAQSECQKVLAVAGTLNQETLDRAVSMLVEARHVHVLALRGTYALSHFFGTFLSTMRASVTILGGPAFQLAEDLARIQPGDLLVAMTYRPYTREVVKAVNLAKAEGIPVLSLTDAGSAIEVSGAAGTTIVVDQPYYFDSMLPHYFAAEALLMAVLRKLGPKALQTTRRREAFVKAMEVEIK